MPPAEPQKKRGKARMSLLIGLFVCILGLQFLMLPTVMLAFFGMLPTLVALIVDRSTEKYAMFCVGGFNLCGVVPYMLDLWFGVHSVGAAYDLITNVFNIAVMYGAAAFGWVIFVFVPPFISSVLAALEERKVSSLRARQRSLIEEWGESVTRGATADHKPFTVANDA